MKKFMLRDTLPDGTQIEREVEELSDKEIKNKSVYNSMWKSIGPSFWHCLYLARKYCPNFSLRVCGFKVIKNDSESKMFSEATKQNFVTVEFFEVSVRVKGGIIDIWIHPNPKQMLSYQNQLEK